MERKKYVRQHENFQILTLSCNISNVSVSDDKVGMFSRLFSSKMLLAPLFLRLWPVMLFSEEGSSG